ncbi:four helix bundle protein [Fodinibius sp. AD559]|uniref:four helix bundle protein n=1 Tax=Fodinibius sp. AD559 TaxID=3424179 RepID=UPI0040469BB2
MRPHYKLEAWKNAMNLVDEIYKISKGFPTEEKFGLTSQMRRSAISVPSNLAEGAARKSKAEFANFVNIAKGSLSELETQLIISKRQNYIHNISSLLDLTGKVSSQLNGLQNYLTTNN